MKPTLGNKHNSKASFLTLEPGHVHQKGIHLLCEMASDLNYLTR